MVFRRTHACMALFLALAGCHRGPAIEVRRLELAEVTAICWLGWVASTLAGA